MRFLLAIVLLAGCGNWSNEDLEYVYALPQKETLKSQLEAMGSTNQQPLSVGDPSKVYDDVKKQSDEFNNGIDRILGFIDLIRTIPPTKRLDNARFWGPYEDKEKNPGFEGQIEIYRKEDGNFTWAIKSRKLGGDWFTLGGGDFKPTASIRKGQGHFYFDAVAQRTLAQTMAKDDINRIDVGYATDIDPVIVHLEVKASDSKSLVYDFNGASDKSASLTFQLDNTGDLNMSTVHALVGWDKTTAGRSEYLIIQGAYAGFSVIECWSDAHTIVYGKQNFPGGMEVGNPADCALQTIELKPLPP